MQQLVSTKTDFVDFLYKASPINAADKIKIPVFVAGGRDDRLVPIIQSYRLVRKMKRAGNKPVTYFKIDETHGFNYEKNRVRYYQNVLEFLDKNMKKNIR
jgi:dipeptidyl aminopeptidase/acylaminoacyl peptidase